MSAWLSNQFPNQSLSLAVLALAGWRAMHLKASALVEPTALRRARRKTMDQFMRLVTVVAGH